MSNALILGRLPIHKKRKHIYASVMCYRLIFLLLCQFKAKGTDKFPVHELTAPELSKALGLLYRLTLPDIQALMVEAAGFVTLEEKGSEECTVRWIDEAAYDKETHTLRLRLSTQLKPYVFSLTEKFTQVHALDEAMRLRSRHSLLLWAILCGFRQYQRKKIHSIPYRQLLLALHVPLDDAESMPWWEFKRDVLLPAQVEIQTKFLVQFKWKPRRSGTKRGVPEFVDFYEQIALNTTEQTVLADTTSDQSMVDTVERRRKIARWHDPVTEFRSDPEGEYADADAEYHNAAPVDPIALQKQIEAYDAREAERKKNHQATDEEIKVWIKQQREAKGVIKSGR